MSYIEMPVAEYRRRLAALPAPRPDRPAVTDDAVHAARIRYPHAFTALDAEPGLGAAEIAEAERLIVAAIRAIHRRTLDEQVTPSRTHPIRASGRSSP